MIEDFETLYQLVATLIAAIAALYGWVKSKRATAAENYAHDVQGFFDPDNQDVWTPPAGTPERSYKMSQEARNFLVSGCSPEDRQSMLDQVDTAEAQGLVDYKVAFSRGYFNISYGQIAGGVTFS